MNAFFWSQWRDNNGRHPDIMILGLGSTGVNATLKPQLYTPRGMISGPTQGPPTIQPNSTLYINNLNTKIKKPELRGLLYALFSTHGQILSLVATKTATGRGQAFVVYKDLSSAVSAMRALQGYPLCDKSLRIQFAKTKSNATKEMEIILSGGSINYSTKENCVVLTY